MPLFVGVFTSSIFFVIYLQGKCKTARDRSMQWLFVALQPERKKGRRGEHEPRGTSSAFLDGHCIRQVDASVPTQDAGVLVQVRQLAERVAVMLVQVSAVVSLRSL